MKRLFRELGLILALAGLWAVSGYLIGLALEIIGFDVYRFSITVAAINVILGMIIFLRMTSDPDVERTFFEVGVTFIPGKSKAGCLWLMPLIAFIYGVSMWVWAIVVRFIFPE